MKLNEVKLWKFNILDLAIVVVVMFFGGLFLLTHMNLNDDGAVTTGNSNVGSKFSYTILVKGLSETSKEMLKIGDDVYDKISNTYIGKISNLEITEAKDLLEDLNGNVILEEIPGKIDVLISIDTDGVIKNGEYLANGLIRIMVGNLKEIKTKYLMCFGTVNSIERNI